MALSDHTCLSRFSGRLAGIPYKLPFAEIVAKSEFGESGHWRISTGDMSKIATDRPLSRMRQCAIDPSLPFATGRFGEG